MHSDQLQSGDLIFYFNSTNKAEHLALYAGSKNGVPYVLHATSAPHHAVMLTNLVAADEGCSYQIMRPLNIDLALDAKQILLDWVEFLVPFASADKQDKIYNKIDDLGGFNNSSNADAIQETYGKATYIKNYSQYLLMANHLPFIPINYTKEGKIEGLRCTETIIAAYNIALLMMHATYLSNLWTIEHVATLDEFANTLDNPLPFDSTVAMPIGVYKHCMENPVHWNNLGELTLLPYPKPDPASKADWREFKESLRKVAVENTSRFIASPKSSIENRDLSRCFTFKPGAECSAASATASSPARGRACSLSFIERNEDDPSQAKLKESPIYCTFFNIQPQPVSSEAIGFLPISTPTLPSQSEQKPAAVACKSPS